MIGVGVRFEGDAGEVTALQEKVTASRSPEGALVTMIGPSGLRQVHIAPRAIADLVPA